MYTEIKGKLKKPTIASLQTRAVRLENARLLGLTLTPSGTHLLNKTIAHNCVFTSCTIHGDALPVGGAKNCSFSRCTFTGKIPSSFVNCRFFDCTFSHAVFTWAISGCEFEESIGNLAFYGNIVERVLLTGSTFDGLSFEDCRIQDCPSIFTSVGSIHNLTISGVEVEGCKYYASCSFSDFGESNRTITAVRTPEGVLFFCGCFKGSTSELKEYIRSRQQGLAPSRTKAMNFLLSCLKTPKTKSRK
jgi:uncharacterized protein YjbI with pentapeptide repeats